VGRRPRRRRTLAVTLTADGPGGTSLQLRHAPAASPSALSDAPTMAAGWDGYLTGLAVVLAGGDEPAVVAAQLERFDGTRAHYAELAAGIADD
jgi:hypothetical protein